MLGQAWEVQSVALLMALCIGSSAWAQERVEAEQKEEEGLSWVGFPTFKFNDDSGFVYGAQASLIDVQEGLEPFVWELRARAEHSTRNRHDHALVWDAPHGIPLGRLSVRAEVLHVDDANYFGVGNGTVRPSSESQTRMRLTQPRSQINLRRDFDQGLFVSGGVEASWVRIRAREDSLLEQQRPLGWDGSHALVLRGGVGYDTRDDEIIPRSGVLTELYLKGASDALGSSSTFGGVGATQQVYLAPFSWMVLAGRLMVDAQMGDVPLAELYRMGGERSFRGLGGVFSQRGYSEGRFIGRTKALGNGELRLLAPLVWGGLQLGGGPFVDASRVVDGGPIWEDVHVSGGGELVIGWKNLLVFRMDYAVSDEEGLFYIEGRYLF
ncbi:MAG: BamA/TamA family outer membrane protein [Myxococcota bacterium]